MSDAKLNDEIHGVYKNLLESFDPATKQLAQAGKGVVKALQGLTFANKLYAEALEKVAGSYSGRRTQERDSSNEISKPSLPGCLNQAAETIKQLAAEQEKIGLFFAKQFLQPMENNLEKDSKQLHDLQKAYEKDFKQAQKEFHKAQKSASKRRSSSSAAEDSPQLTAEVIAQAQLMNQLSDWHKVAINEEDKRFAFILHRHILLGNLYLEHWDKASSLNKHLLPVWQAVFDGATNANMPAATEQAPTTPPPQTLYLHGGNFEYDSSFAAVAPQAPQNLAEGAILAEIISGQVPNGLPTHTQQGNTVHNERRRLSSAAEAEQLQQIIDHARSELEQRAPAPINANEAETLAQQQYVEQQFTDIVNLRESNGYDIEVLESERNAIAVQLFRAYEETQLSFAQGDLLKIVKIGQKGWLYGENCSDKTTGWFPASYARDINGGGIGISSSRGSSELDLRPCDPPGSGIRGGHAFKPPTNQGSSGRNSSASNIPDAPPLDGLHIQRPMSLMERSTAQLAENGYAAVNRNTIIGAPRSPPPSANYHVQPTPTPSHQVPPGANFPQTGPNGAKHFLAPVKQASIDRSPVVVHKPPTAATLGLDTLPKHNPFGHIKLRPVVVMEEDGTAMPRKLQ